jgi:uncharacterized membrane protein
VRHRVFQDRRASVAVWIAMITPLATIAMAVSMEVSAWSAAQIRMQRIADVAAVSGALTYNGTSNAQTSATAAAKLADVITCFPSSAASFSSRAA